MSEKKLDALQTFLVQCGGRNGFRSARKILCWNPQTGDSMYLFGWFDENEKPELPNWLDGWKTYLIS